MTLSQLLLSLPVTTQSHKVTHIPDGVKSAHSNTGCLQHSLDFFHLNSLLLLAVFVSLLEANWGWRNAQELRVLVAFPEDLGLIPNSHIDSYNSSSRESNTLFWPLQVPGMYKLHSHTCRQSNYTHKIK